MLKLLTIGLVVIMSSCTKEQRTPAPPPPVLDTVPAPTPPPGAREYTYLALGDSYTIGEGVTEQARYPLQAAALLRIDSIFFDTPEIIARTGWTTRNLLTQLEVVPPKRATYDWVTLLIGVNNQYQRLSITTYATEFRELLLKAISYADGRKEHVTVLSIPDYSVTPFAAGSNRAAISEAIDEFNRVNKEITLSLGCGYLDITPSTRLAANDNSLLAADGLHPSGSEYKKWADLLYASMKATLR